MPSRKIILKQILGELPFTVEMYWLLRQRKKPFKSHYDLEKLRNVLPGACEQVRPHLQSTLQVKNVFIFTTLHYWVEQTTLTSLVLAGMGNQVTMMYLPYSRYKLPLNAFDRRRNNIYTREVLAPTENIFKSISMLDVRLTAELPDELEQTVRQLAVLDLQYTHESEDVDLDSDLYAMRLERNRFAARAALSWLQANRPDVVVIPNGTILELGVVYRVARYLDLPIVTYEFNDQREQMWIALDDEIMHQNTDPIWQEYGDVPLTDVQRQRIGTMEAARKGARSYGQSDRLWQNVPTQGSGKMRTALGLDSRPFILLATNVLGDSLTLDRNIFAESMAEWITRTLLYFSKREDAQLIVRIHPGERYLRGKSMVDVVKETLPELPEHIHLVGPLEDINTYDLMELTSLGLVYTTTTGLEMAMEGIPVMVCGSTHYRKRGFTIDPQTWDEYFAALDQILASPAAHRLPQAQIERAWNYAYRFFFQYPRPFPWRLVGLWQDYELWPVERVLGEEGQARFGDTFRSLAGEPIHWEDTL